MGITLQAAFAKATTTVDGGWNITFSVSQDEAQAVLQLSQMRDSLLQLAVIPVSVRRSNPIPAEVERDLTGLSGLTDDFSSTLKDLVNDDGTT